MRRFRPRPLVAAIVALASAGTARGGGPVGRPLPCLSAADTCPLPAPRPAANGIAPLAVAGAADGEPPRGLATASCASSSCHGGPRGGNHAVHSFAATTWVGDDPHAGAYETLFEARSVRMARLLGIGPPHTERECLVCHSVQDAAPDPLPRAVLADGVGCAACHGDARGWLEVHTLADWRTRSAADKAATGFHDLSGPLERARICARCHVGDADHDMHHDHVAAGHPRLLFELGQLQRRWPRHWDPRGTVEANEDFQARSWAVGQAAALEAAATLLAARAERAASALHSGRPARWPEYTEFDCQACHRTLATAAALVGADDRPRTLPPGTPGWQPWIVTGSGLLATAVTEPGEAPSARVATRVAALRHLLARDWSASDPERIEHIAAEARAIAGDAGVVAAALAAAPTIRVVARGAAVDRVAAGDPRLWQGWDAAVQTTLALEADRRGGPAPLGVRAAEAADALDTLREGLRYPVGWDAPVGFDGGRFRRLRDAVP